MRYVEIQNSISIKDIANNNYCLAPSKYSFFYSKSNRFIPLGKIIGIKNDRIGVQKDSKYYYIEIGDINVNNGSVDYKENFGVFLPGQRPLKIDYEDILISTVRTYRKGIGFINFKSDNITSTPAFLVINKVSKEITKEYLFAILRSDFFVEQILSFQNRGMYPRLDRDNIDLVSIPLPRTKEELAYVSVLQRALLNKNEEIKRKKEIISNSINSEILNNQLPNRFHFTYPNFDDIKSINRLDTGIFSKQFKEIDFLIKNYKKGFYYINKENIKSGNTPIKRLFGAKNIYKYRWITPTHFSDWGTLEFNESILCDNNNLTENSLLLVNRTSKGGLGEYVGNAVYYDTNIYGEGHHNQGIYRITGYEDSKLQYMACFMNSPFMRKYCSGLSVGAKMKEIKSKQFLTIPIPNMPDDIKKGITRLYFNNVSFDTSKLRIGSFLSDDSKWNKSAGITQIDHSAKIIQNQLHNVIDGIILNKKVDYTFDFLKKS